MKNRKFSLVLILVFFSSIVFSATVTVKSPNGGEPWQLGSEQLIEWEKSGDFTKFRIIILKANIRVGDIVLNVNPGLTSYSWKKVGEYMQGNLATGNDYKIRIRGYLVGGGSVIDDSNQNFSITPKSKSRLVQQTTVKLAKMIYDISISPAGGKYVTGQKLNISWKTNWKTAYNQICLLELYSGSGKKLKRTIGTTKPGYKSFNWPIPGDIWPEFYTIQVTYRESDGLVRGLSSKFHISRSYAAEPKEYVIPGEISNGWRISNKGDARISDCKREKKKRDPVPGPGVVMVGYTYHDRVANFDDVIDWGECINYYRSFAYFNLKSIPKDGILEEAVLKYNKQIGRCNSYAVANTVDQQWNNNIGLWKIKASYLAGLKGEPVHISKEIIKKWLAFPDAKFGILVTGPGQGHGKIGCLLFYNNVKLVLKIRELK